MSYNSASLYYNVLPFTIEYQFYRRLLESEKCLRSETIPLTQNAEKTAKHWYKSIPGPIPSPLPCSYCKYVTVHKVQTYLTAIWTIQTLNRDSRQQNRDLSAHLCYTDRDIELKYYGLFVVVFFNCSYSHISKCLLYW